MSSTTLSTTALSHEELPGQLETDPTSETIGVFHAKARDVIDQDTPVHKPFSEGIVPKNIPQHVQDSWSYVQKLSSEQQSKISYYEKSGEWFINIDGIKISLQNESNKYSESNTEKGINVEKSNTYFTQSAARARAASKGRTLPTSALWTQMANFLGGFEQLRNILQIPLTGWLVPESNLKYFGSMAAVWSRDFRECLYVGADGGHILGHAYSPSDGQSVRLLDA